MLVCSEIADRMKMGIHCIVKDKFGTYSSRFYDWH